MFNKYVCFSKIKLDSKSQVVFQNCIFNDEFEIENFESNQLSFYNCQFRKAVLISFVEAAFFRLDSSSFDNLELSDLRIKSSLHFISTNIKSLKFYNIKCHRFDIKTKSEKIELINFYNCKEIEYLDIDAETIIDNLWIDEISVCRIKGKFNKVMLFPETFKNIDIGFIDESNKSEINELFYQSRSFEGALTLQNLKISKLNLLNLNSNKGNTRFTNLEIDTINLIDVSISNFIWNNVILKKEVYFKRCDLSGLKPNNVSWLKDRKLSPDYISKKYQNNDLIEMRYQRDMYRQLKIAYENNKDKIESLTFYRNEMRLYWKEIKNAEKSNEKSNHGQLLNDFDFFKRHVYLLFSIINHRENKFLIRVNYIVSNFGQSYLRPLVFLLTLQFVFCCVIWYNESCNIVFSKNNFVAGLSQYLTWINPIFKAPENWCSSTTIISTLMRMVNSFLIYHFIKATRKFS